MNLYHVLTLADERFAVPLAACGRSLLTHLPEDGKLHLVVIDGGLKPATRDRLLASWRSPRLEVRFVAPSLPAGLPLWGRIPAITYSRILAANAFEDSVERLLIIDSDSIVCHSLADIFHLPMPGEILLAAQDPAIPSVDSFDGLADWRALGLAPGAPYFNAGVMLVHLPRWRAAGVADSAFAFIAAHGKKLKYFDQDALNATVRGQWAPLDPRWQVQPRLAAHLDPGERARLLDDPWLYHFSGRVKPWEVNDCTAATQKFYSYLDQTAWRGWRPAPSALSSAITFYDAHLRRHVYPLERLICAAQRMATRR